MGGSCCDDKSEVTGRLAQGQLRVLWVVLAINLVMFVVEIGASLVANSLAMMSDSLDMLGDAIAYGASIYVVKRGAKAKARSAVLKAWIIMISAIGILVASVFRMLHAEVPEAHLMTSIGALALAANTVCLILLTRYRNLDINMSSVWLCSRNDIISNASVLCAAGLVTLTASPWPDLVVGTALACLFAKSALGIFAESRRLLRE